MNMATYETFAAVYDAVMDDSLYDLWTDFFPPASSLKVRIGKNYWNWLVGQGSSLFVFLKLVLM